MADRFAIKLSGHDQPIPAGPGESILEACLAAGLPMPYNCRSGECAECRALLLRGTVVENPGADPAIFTDADRKKNRILTCLCAPTSDIDLEILLRDGSAAPKIERVDATAERVEKVSTSVVQVELSTPTEIDYRAGQYFEWALPGISPNRNFSAANRPGGSRVVFDVRIYPGGQVGDHVQTSLHPGDVVELIGPYGHFGFTDNEHRPAICVAGGTGLAPIKAMIESATAAKDGRKIELFYGAREATDLYDLDVLARWADQNTDFSFHVALSDEPAGSTWTGARGMVTDLVAASVFDGFGLEAYLCGPPPMIDAITPILQALGLEADDIYADRFSPAKS